MARVYASFSASPDAIGGEENVCSSKGVPPSKEPKELQRQAVRRGVGDGRDDYSP